MSEPIKPTDSGDGAQPAPRKTFDRRALLVGGGAAAAGALAYLVLFGTEARRLLRGGRS